MRASYVDDSKTLDMVWSCFQVTMTRRKSEKAVGFVSDDTCQSRWKHEIEKSEMWREFADVPPAHV